MFAPRKALAPDSESRRVQRAVGGSLRPRSKVSRLAYKSASAAEPIVPARARLRNTTDRMNPDENGMGPREQNSVRRRRARNKSPPDRAAQVPGPLLAMAGQRFPQGKHSKATHPKAPYVALCAADRNR